MSRWAPGCVNMRLAVAGTPSPARTPRRRWKTRGKVGTGTCSPDKSIPSSRITRVTPVLFSTELTFARRNTRSSPGHSVSSVALTPDGGSPQGLSC